MAENNANLFFRSLHGKGILGWSCIFLAIAFTNTNTAFAHHGEHHDTPTPAAPQPLPAPPPPPPPPSPASTFNSSQLPVLFNGFIAPTDTTGIGGGLGMAEGLKQNLAPTNMHSHSNKPKFANLPQRDWRYQFGGAWHSLNPQNANQNENAADPATKNSKSMQFGHIEANVKTKGKDGFAHVMPSKDSKYEVVNANTVHLSEGAILAKSTGAPLKVRFIKNNIPAEVTITGGTMVLISLIEQTPFIVNLTDKCCSACFLTIDQSPVSKQGQDIQPTKQRIVLGLGELAQIVPDATEPALPAGSTKLIQAIKLRQNGSVKLARYHYIATMRRMNLASALPKQDLKQVLKSAAAAHHAMSHKGY